MKKKISLILLCILMLFSLISCNNNKSNDVVILFTNDVHCGIDENIGYSGLSSYKKEMEEQYENVVLVDCGDFLQGSYEGTVSKGLYLTEIMNAVGYDFVIFGNHEFDYGMKALKKNIEELNAEFLNCNVHYIGADEDWLSAMSKPFVVKEYGKIKVGFVGVSTPRTIMDSTPTLFMEDGKYVYDFTGDSKEEFFSNVQNNVDECINKGADFVVLLSHLGVDVEQNSPFTSIELAENTNGIDVILDAHTHISASCWVKENKDGDEVLISSTGTKLDKIGKLVLSKDGTINIGYIDSYEKKDEEITALIADIRKDFEEQINTVVGHIDIDLSLYDNDGIRMVRNREIPIGDFVADAYRIIGNADIGMCNGGGIRADLLSGDITYEELIAVNPFGNTLCVVKVTGKELLDMLEYFYRYTEKEYKDGDIALGEDGSFQQVSGIKFTVDTSVTSSVETDETDALTSISGSRRISDVYVLKNGEYVPIDLNETYTMASHNYMIKNGGSGMLLYLQDHELVIDEAISDYQVLIDYLSTLNGDLSMYQTVDNRITIK